MPRSTTPSPQARRATSPGQVLAIVCVGICLANLDLSIVNVGMPNISREFGEASLEDMSWVLNGSAITYAAPLVFFGRLAERHDRNLSFLLGIGLFTAASAACAMAAGAALMTPASLGLLLASSPPERRGAAVRTWTAIGGLAAALGPLVGGLLVTLSWRWIFLVNVPVGVIAIVVGWLRLPHVPGHDVPRPDPWAALLVTGGIAAFICAIVKLNDWGWSSLGIVASLGASVVLLALFVRQCLSSRNPFVDPTLFRIRLFLGAALVMTPFSAGFGAMLLSVALWEQTAWGWSALQTGLAIAPATSLLLSARLIARFGAAAVVAAGVLSFVTGLGVWAAFVDVEPNATMVVLGMLPIGVGVGLACPTLMGVGVASLPASSFATGSGVISMIRQAMLAVGVAAFVAIVGSPAVPLRT